MENCKLCGMPFENPEERDRGLCEGCDMAVSIDALEKLRMMRRCEHIINSSTRHQVRLYNCLLLVQKAKWLRRYERLGIQTIAPVPSEWIARYTDRYDEIIMERIFEEVNDALARAEHSTVTGTLDTHINAVLQTVDEGKRHFLNKAKYDSLNTRVMDYLYSNLLALTI